MEVQSHKESKIVAHITKTPISDEITTKSTKCNKKKCVGLDKDKCTSSGCISNTDIEECQELKNLKYKNMMISGNVSKSSNSVQTKKANIDMFLDKESNLNKSVPWNKIDKTEKIRLLTEYVKINAATYSLSDSEINNYKEYLVDSLDKKKLQHVKDVQYDIQKGKINSIPNLLFNATSRKFTFKRNEKRASTVKSLGNGKKIVNKKHLNDEKSI